MGPMRSRAINSHLASASLTCEEKYKNRGSGLLIKGCSLKPKYLMIASISIHAGKYEIVWQYSLHFVKRGVKVATTLRPSGTSEMYKSSIPTRTIQQGNVQAAFDPSHRLPIPLRHGCPHPTSCSKWWV